MPTDEQVFSMLAAEGPVEEAGAGDSTVSTALDPALRVVYVPHEGGERCYPIPTAYEEQMLQLTGELPVGTAGVAGAYIIWLSQRRTPGHRRRVFDAAHGRISRRQLRRAYGVGWWDRLTNWLTGRRPLDADDPSLMRVALGAVGEWRKKKETEAVASARLSP